jgi:hypothetical protein
MYNRVSLVMIRVLRLGSVANRIWQVRQRISSAASWDILVRAIGSRNLDIPGQLIDRLQIAEEIAMEQI